MPKSAILMSAACYEAVILIIMQLWQMQEDLGIELVAPHVHHKARLSGPLGNRGIDSLVAA